jgi:DNA primase
MTDAMSVGELPTHGVGALLEHYRDTPHAPVLARISGQLADAPLDEAMLEPQFNDTLYKLESVLVEKEITALNTRARESGLEPTARRRLAELLSLKEKLKTRAKASDS